MVPIDLCTQILMPCSSKKTSKLIKAAAVREPALAKGRGDVSLYIFTAVTITKDTHCAQCHTDITDILAFRPKRRRNGMNLSGKRRITYPAGTGFPRSKTAGLKMIRSVCKKMKGTAEPAGGLVTEYGPVFLDRVFYGVFP